MNVWVNGCCRIYRRLARAFPEEFRTICGDGLEQLGEDLMPVVWRDQGVAGATVIRGIEGFGANAHLHTTRILRLSEDLPILIEVVDQEDRIRAILPELDAMVGDGLITLEKIEVLAYRGGPRDA